MKKTIFNIIFLLLSFCSTRIVQSADISFGNYLGDFQESPGITAAQKSQEAIIQGDVAQAYSILEEARMTLVPDELKKICLYADAGGFTLLLRAVLRDNLRLVECILSLVKQSDLPAHAIEEMLQSQLEHGTTALWHAVKKNALGIVDLLLRTVRENNISLQKILTKENICGVSSLMLAARLQNPALLMYILLDARGNMSQDALRTLLDQQSSRATTLFEESTGETRRALEEFVEGLDYYYGEDDMIKPAV